MNPIPPDDGKKMSEPRDCVRELLDKCTAHSSEDRRWQYLTNLTKERVLENISLNTENLSVTDRLQLEMKIKYWLDLWYEKATIERDEYWKI